MEKEDKGLVIYRMKPNEMMGADCLSVLIEPKKRYRGLTSEYILLFLKYPKSVDLDKVEKNNLSEFFDPSEELFIRIGSECYLSYWGDSHCDCRKTQEKSMKYIGEQSQGIYIHLPMEAKGHDLRYKFQEVELQVSGLSQEGEKVGKLGIEEAHTFLTGHNGVENRDFSILKEILQTIGVYNSEYKISLVVDREDVIGRYKDIIPNIKKHYRI